MTWFHVKHLVLTLNFVVHKNVIRVLIEIIVAEIIVAVAGIIVVVAIILSILTILAVQDINISHLIVNVIVVAHAWLILIQRLIRLLRKLSRW